MANAATSKVIFGNEVLMDLTSDTVDAAHLLRGYSAHGADGQPVSGACDFDSDTTDADATASMILATKTAYVNKAKITGEMPNRGEVHGHISSLSTPYSIQNGYHDGSGDVDIDSVEAAKIIPGNIKSGISILGVTGDYAGDPVTAGAITATPYTTAKTYLPPTGKDYISQATVNAISVTRVQDQVHGGMIVTIGDIDPDA